MYYEKIYNFDTVGKLEEACKAVTSYLFINPDSEYMNENLKYYKALNGTKPEYFKIRSVSSINYFVIQIVFWWYLWFTGST